MSYQYRSDCKPERIPYSSKQQLCSFLDTNNLEKRCMPKVPCCPCPPIIRKSNAHIGLDGPVTTGGPTGTFPMDTIYVVNGLNILGTDPILLKGRYTYSVEWSLNVDPIDTDATVSIELLLDGNPVNGSGSFESITTSTEGFVTLSGGAIINVSSDVQTLQLRYVTGESGIISQDVNVRIVQIG